MLKTYCNSGCLFVIDSDGSILVSQGDSIKKYSMAIHGDFEHLDEYYRKDGNKLNRINQRGRIYYNEKIYHKPSIPREHLAMLKVQSKEISPTTLTNDAEASRAIRNEVRAFMERK